MEAELRGRSRGRSVTGSCWVRGGISGPGPGADFGAVQVSELILEPGGRFLPACRRVPENLRNTTFLSAIS